MLTTLERAMPPPPDATPPGAHAFRCTRCGRHLGWFRAGVLHEPDGSVSGLPVVRRCTRCRKLNRRLTAPR